jgi:hypothetical protein
MFTLVHPTVACSTAVQFLNWKFGPSLEDLKLGFCMHFLPDAESTSLEWLYEGDCSNTGIARMPCTRPRPS